VSFPDKSLLWNDISYAVGEKMILNRVNAYAPAEKITCLLGASGSGKSTLLRLSAGFFPPSQGNFFLRGRLCAQNGKNLLPTERHGIAFMFQDYALFPNLTALENVMFADRVSDREAKRGKALQILSDIGLGAAVDKYPHNLSGGEAQRVALARAVMQNTDIVFLDEPFSNADENLREKLREETVGYLKSLNKTQIIVTHNPDEAFTLSDHIILLRNGAVIQSGTAEEIYRNPADRDAARFTGGVNIFPGEIKNHVIHTAIGAFPADRLPEGAADLFVRRDSFRLANQNDPSAPKITAQVRERKFCGAVTRYALQSGNFGFIAQFPADQSPATDTQILVLQLKTDGVFIFSR
jgi:iron(III) transport system ATP-binding protein